MAKAKNKKQFDRSKGILVIVIALLLLFLGVFALALHQKPKAKMIMSTGVHASVGPLQYKVEDNKAVKRTDQHIVDLQEFLEEEGKKNIKLGCTTVYHNVIAASENENQVLLNYGCEYPSARMFAVHESGVWKTISPTNQFDTFGTPLCNHVEQNDIDTSLAPVCVKDLEVPASEYEYVVR